MGTIVIETLNLGKMAADLSFIAFPRKTIHQLLDYEDYRFLKDKRPKLKNMLCSTSRSMS